MSVGSNFGINGEIKTECLSAVLVQSESFVGAKSYDDINKNIDKIIKTIDQICGGMPGIDIIITPESSLHGFSKTGFMFPITEDGPELARLKKKCKEQRVWLVVGCFMKFDDDHFVRNCAVTINDKGKIVCNYAKTNPWTPMEPSYPGNEIKVFKGPKGSRIATIICFDGDFQNVWSECAEKGANVIIRISEYMTPHENAYEITNRAGAYFNRCYVLATNTCNQNDLFCLFGKSMAVNYDGNILAEAPVGIPYIFKVDIFPGLCDHMKNNSFEQTLPWQTFHRGAATPELGGLGLGNKKLYSTINKKNNERE